MPFKLHVKDITRIDTRALLELPSESEQVRADCEEALRWLHDDSLYSRVPVRGADGIPAARMTGDQVQQLVDFGIVRPIAREDVRGHVRMFLVEEAAKHRFRPIKYTKDANDALGRETLMEMHFPTKNDLCQLVNKGDYFIALDFSAYFDAFLYSPQVGHRFCFRHEKDYYSLECLAMGQRQAVQVAMNTTHQLLNFPKKSHTDVVIDNVIFVGSTEDTLRDAAEFIRRCALVRAQLNEDTSDLSKLVAQRGEWCGIHLDFAAKEVALSQKTVGRTADSWQRRACWTWRGLAAHLGLLFWSWGITDVEVSRYFGLLAFMSKMSANLTENPHLWDSPCFIYPSAMLPLAHWTELIAQNTPRLVPVSLDPQWIVCTDASRWGWGYVAVKKATSEVRTHGERWSHFMEQKYGVRLGASTIAEPHGLVNSLLHLIAPGKDKSVLVGTDNSATRWSFERTFSSRSIAINEAITRLRDRLPGVQIKYMHVAGVLNLADRVSRGGSYTKEELPDVGRSLRQVVGGH